MQDLILSENVKVKLYNKSIILNKGTIILEASRAALRYAAGSQLPVPKSAPKIEYKDSTEGDEHVTGKSSWTPIGEYDVRTIQREKKIFATTREGKKILIPFKKQSIELKNKQTGDIVEFITYTFRKELRYKKLDSSSRNALRITSEMIGLTTEQTQTLFRKTPEQIEDQLKQMYENEKYDIKKIPRLPRIKEIKAKIKPALDSQPKEAIVKNLSSMLNIAEEDADKLLNWGSTPYGIEQKPEESPEETHNKKMGRVKALLDMHDDIIKEVEIAKDINDLEELKELYAQGVDTERKLKEFGITTPQSVEKLIDRAKIGQVGPSAIVPASMKPTHVAEVPRPKEPQKPESEPTQTKKLKDQKVLELLKAKLAELESKNESKELINIIEEAKELGLFKY
jgi:hypothetical protein